MISPCANIQYVTKTNLLLQNPPVASVKLLKTKVFVCSKQTKQQLSQTNTTRSILPSFGDSQHKDVEIINSYPPKWKWLTVDIYRAAERWGKYLTLVTDTKGDNCFSICLVSV